jgi:UDP-N-acetylglucosamine 1-carboxyvinyltransferase
MEVFKVTGNGALSGKVQIGGAKNAALPILAASLLTRGGRRTAQCSPT